MTTGVGLCPGNTSQLESGAEVRAGAVNEPHVPGREVGGKVRPGSVLEENLRSSGERGEGSEQEQSERQETPGRREDRRLSWGGWLQARMTQDLLLHVIGGCCPHLRAGHCKEGTEAAGGRRPGLEAMELSWEDFGHEWGGRHSDSMTERTF